MLAPLATFFQHVCGDITFLKLDTERRIIPVDRLHLDQIDYTFELTLRAYRQLDRNGVRAQAVLDLTHYTQEISAGTIHLVHESDPWHLVSVGLAPDGL